MNVALPNGQTATFRDVLMRGDIREARRGMVFVTSPDGSRRTDGALLDDLTGRVITRMLVSWTLPDLPTPANAQGEHLQQQILDRLDSDTYGALETAVGPWVTRILQMNRTTYQFTHNGSGETFDVTDPQQAQRLAASPDFTAIESPDPKKRRAEEYRQFFLGLGTWPDEHGVGPDDTEFDLIRRGRVVLSIADLDETPVGWLEELALQEAGHDMAVAVMQQKSKRSRTPDLNQGDGKPVYGMPGARWTPGRGMH